MVEELVAFLDTLPPVALYVALFVAGAVETAFPPFPGDAVTVVCSFALARQGAALLPALALSSSGSYLGGFILWAAGRHWSAHPSASRWAGRQGFVRAQVLVSRRGPLLVMASRFIPGIRSLILLAAGYGGMPLGQIWWSLAVAVSLWQGIVVTGGYVLGRSWLRVVNLLGNAGLALVFAGAALGYLGWRWVRRVRESGGADDTG